MGFLSDYRDRKGEPGAASEAESRLVRDTIASPLVGRNKMTGVDSTDMESVQPDIFVPTLVYTFVYTFDGDVVNGVRFGDAMPVIYCLSRYKGKVTGVNFNMLPPESRAAFLDVVDRASGGFYTKSGVEKASRGGFAACDKIANALSGKGAVESFVKLVDRELGLSVSKAVRTYSMSHIRNPRLVEFSDYRHIPMLECADSVRGASLARVQAATVTPGR